MTFYKPPVLSANKEWLYVATAGNIGGWVAINVGKNFAKDVFEKANWSAVSLNNTAFLGGPGKVKLTDNEQPDTAYGQLGKVNPTHEGLAFVWQIPKSSEEYAVYFKGRQIELAWKIPTALQSFFVLKYNNDEFPYLITKTFIWTKKSLTKSTAQAPKFIYGDLAVV